MLDQFVLLHDALGETGERPACTSLLFDSVTTTYQANSKSVQINQKLQKLQFI